jgi:hypothetical protein
MTTTTTSSGVAVKVRRRRSAEERRNELTTRLSKLDQREYLRVLRRVDKAHGELAKIASMPGAKQDVVSAINQCLSVLTPILLDLPIDP